MRLDGKVAVITGAASGIGHAVAKRYLEADGRVVIADLNADAANAAAKELASEKSAIGVGMDVSKEDQVNSSVEHMVKTFRRVDILGFPGVAAYDASKSGLIGLKQVLAAEYRPQNIRVNALLPGAVETAMYEAANDSAEQKAYLTNLHALKRIASPDEVANAALYLASDASSFQSGTAMLVDGGLSITRT